MTSHQANLEARHAALLAAADSATESGETLLQLAGELRTQAAKLRTPQLPPVSTAGTPPHANPRQL